MSDLLVSGLPVISCGVVDLVYELVCPSPSGCSTDFTALVPFEQDRAWLCLICCKPMICMHRCVYWDALERILFVLCERWSKNDKGSVGFLKGANKKKVRSDLKLPTPPDPRVTCCIVNANITYCWGDSRPLAKSLMTCMLGQDLKADVSVGVEWWKALKLACVIKHTVPGCHPQSQQRLKCNENLQCQTESWTQTIAFVLNVTKQCYPLSPPSPPYETVVFCVDSGWLWFHAFYSVFVCV